VRERLKYSAAQPRPSKRQKKITPKVCENGQLSRFWSFEAPRSSAVLVSFRRRVLG
jgi:hypothetical protein